MHGIELGDGAAKRRTNRSYPACVYAPGPRDRSPEGTLDARAPVAAAAAIGSPAARRPDARRGMSRCCHDAGLGRVDAGTTRHGACSRTQGALKHCCGPSNTNPRRGGCHVSSSTGRVRGWTLKPGLHRRSDLGRLSDDPFDIALFGKRVFTHFPIACSAA